MRILNFCPVSLLLKLIFFNVSSFTCFIKSCLVLLISFILLSLVTASSTD